LSIGITGFSQNYFRQNGPVHAKQEPPERATPAKDFDVQKPCVRLTRRRWDGRADWAGARRAPGCRPPRRSGSRQRCTRGSPERRGRKNADAPWEHCWSGLPGSSADG